MDGGFKTSLLLGGRSCIKKEYVRSARRSTGILSWHGASTGMSARKGRSKKAHLSHLMSKSGKLVTTGEQKAEELNNVLLQCSLSTSRPMSRVDGPQNGDWESKKSIAL